MAVPPQEELQRVGEDFARELGLDDALAEYDAFRFTPAVAPDLPTLHLEDLTAIPFVANVPGVEAYQHRARVRAGDGDLFAAATPASEGYESYCGRLGLGSPELLTPEPDPELGPMAVAAACASGAAFDRLVSVAREHGGLVVHPYMAHEDVWELASLIAESSGVPVRVLGPPPPVLWIANDKSLLTDLVGRVAGTQLVSEHRISDEPRGLAAALLELAVGHGRVALKRLRCAAAMGNRVFDADALKAQGLDATEGQVREFLADTEWDPGEPVIATVWEPAVCSPSTQLWIPPADAGPIRMDGIFEQILEGPEQMFVGSRPSTLPERVHRVLADASLSVAGVLRTLGYVGRCSFDFIVLGDPRERYGAFEVRLTECNGRWGGTSTPMHLTSRLVEGPRPVYRAQDCLHPSLVGVSFRELEARLGAALFAPGDGAVPGKYGAGQFVLYNTGCLEPSGKFDVIAFAESPQAADEACLETLPGLLGVR